jgi:hypothetical protein
VETSNSGTQLDFSDNLTDFRDVAFFVNEQVLALNDKLALTGGLRADRSSANGDRDKYYVFPRASASFRIPDIGDFINEIKVRGGWGRTGNRPRYADRDLLLATGGVIGERHPGPERRPKPPDQARNPHGTRLGADLT